MGLVAGDTVMVLRGGVVVGGGNSGFQVTGWWNGGKNQHPKKSLGLQTKPKNIPGPKFNPPKIQCPISKPSKISRKH